MRSDAVCAGCLLRNMEAELERSACNLESVRDFYRMMVNVWGPQASCSIPIAHRHWLSDLRILNSGTLHMQNNNNNNTLQIELLELVQELGGRISVLTNDQHETYQLLQSLSVTLQFGNVFGTLDWNWVAWYFMAAYYNSKNTNNNDKNIKSTNSI